jgi:ferrous iron transport protein B
VTPVFAPMGITQDNWPATVGLFTGVFAKEAMVGTLDAVYGQLAIEDNPELVAEADKFSFWGRIGEAFASIPANLAELPSALLDPLGINIGDTDNVETAAKEQEVAVGTFGAMAKRFDGKAGAFAYLLFVLLYFPCTSATAAIYRETNLNWTVFVGCWTTGLAYIVASSFYQITRFGQHPLFSAFWLGSMAVLLAGTLFVLRIARPVRSGNSKEAMATES